jgi:hypothetical protein
VFHAICCLDLKSTNIEDVGCPHNNIMGCHRKNSSNFFYRLCKVFSGKISNSGLYAQWISYVGSQPLDVVTFGICRGQLMSNKTRVVGNPWNLGVRHCVHGLITI